jgi:hypothetical protein
MFGRASLPSREDTKICSTCIIYGHTQPNEEGEYRLAKHGGAKFFAGAFDECEQRGSSLKKLCSSACCFLFAQKV